MNNQTRAQQQLPGIVALVVARHNHERIGTAIQTIIAKIDSPWGVIDPLVNEVITLGPNDAQYTHLHDIMAASRHWGNYYRDWC